MGVAKSGLKKLGIFLKRKKAPIIYIFVILAFPMIVGWIYKVLIEQNVMADYGDLLTYYGAAFGIVGSFIKYRSEINKREKEKMAELRPFFIVEVEKVDEIDNVFDINITNQSRSVLRYLCFYDEFISEAPKSKYTFRTTFNKTVEEFKKINAEYNIIDDKILDVTDGFPKYVQLTCDDVEDNAWSCCFYKINDCDKVYYYPRYFGII